MNIELRRNDETYLDALGTVAIPAPTTARLSGWVVSGTIVVLAIRGVGGYFDGRLCAQFVDARKSVDDAKRVQILPLEASKKHPHTEDSHHEEVRHGSAEWLVFRIPFSQP